MMNVIWKSTAMIGSAFMLLVAPLSASAMPNAITYSYGHHLFTIYVNQHPEWHTPTRTWYFHGVKAIPPAELQTCGDEPITIPGWTFSETNDWNEDAIARTIDTDIGSVLNRDPGNVTINRDGTGAITFDGQGLTGRKVDSKLTASLTHVAIESDTSNVTIPVTETQPQITVTDPELQSMGIKEVVTIGESVFAKSPVNRRHNIDVGVSKFNGHLIPKDSVFSFDEVLGPVNDKTGYRKELVIQGDKTLPDYGGGLCQVSSTAYRGPWEYGLPILQRKNHSYVVSYYSPQGTDATIYPPNVDMKFKNDTPGALLIQSFVDDQDRAFFIYYGTKDDRQTDVIGPYITDRQSAPKEEKIIYTTDVPPGQKMKAGERHDGMNVIWYRSVQRAGTGATMERYYSSYEARALTWEIGITPEDKAKLTAGDTSSDPSWLPSTP